MTTPQTHALTLAFVGHAEPAQRSRAHAYEDEVLALLPEHGARLLYRGVAAPGQDAALPVEVQLLWFPAREALDAFLADPRRRALLAKYGEVFTRKEVVEMQTATTATTVRAVGEPGGGQGMNRPRGLPDWEQVYQAEGVETMPWYYPALDPDVAAALAAWPPPAGRALDLGTGPGTQAIALAERGFDVVGSDLSATAVRRATEAAARRGVRATFVADDVLASKLTGPFAMVLDRGCFHTLPPDARAGYVETVARLIAPGGYLFLKTFSHKQPGEQGPFRFTPAQLEALFGGRFALRELRETVYQGALAPLPLALFCVFQAPARG